MKKIWYRQVPVYGSVLLASVLADPNAAIAAGTSITQPTPGITTPDEAVRLMAIGAIKDSQKTAAKQIPSSGNLNNFSAATPVTKSSKSVMASPSRVLNNCRGGSCEFDSARPPVTLGTAAPMSIKSAISPSVIPNYTSPIVAAPAPLAGSSDSVVIKPSNNSVKTLESSSLTNNFPEIDTSQPKTAEKPTEKTSLFGGVNQQLANLKNMAVSGSRQILTAFPIDTSLFAMGNGFASAKAVSFNPRLTLGNLDVTVKPIAYFNTTPQNLISVESIILKQPTPNKMLLLGKNLHSSNTPKLLLLSSNS